MAKGKYTIKAKYKKRLDKQLKEPKDYKPSYTNKTQKETK